MIKKSGESNDKIVSKEVLLVQSCSLLLFFNKYFAIYIVDYFIK